MKTAILYLLATLAVVALSIYIENFYLTVGYVLATGVFLLLDNDKGSAT